MLILLLTFNSNFMKTKLLFLVCLLSFTVSQSQTFNDGVLQYTVTDGTNVSVIKYNDVCPTGDLIIPETIMDNSISYTITSIGNFAFSTCTDLTSVIIPDSVTRIKESAFEECTGVMSFNIPNNITSIGAGAFALCSSLTSVDIPNSVTSLGDFAYAFCSGLSNVSISDSVTSIGEYAFVECTSLTSVIVNWDVPLSINANVFQNVVIGSIPLTVPSGALSAYQAAPVWQDFASFVLSIEDINSGTAFQLYPNPVKDELNINLNKGLELKQVNIYNIQSQYLYSFKTSKIDIRNLASGIYFIEVETNKGNATKKIVVE